MHILKNLKVWLKSMELVTKVYKVASKLPKEEIYGLTSQIKRSAISIPSNIAEGAGRNSDKEFVRFLSIAQGSSYELQTQIILANKLGLIEKQSANSLLEYITEVQKMNFSLQKSVINKS